MDNFDQFLATAKSADFRGSFPREGLSRGDREAVAKFSGGSPESARIKRTALLGDHTVASRAAS